MQLRYLLFMTVALLALGFFACEQENFDETMEEVLPTDTTKVITDKGSLQYNLQGVQFRYENGFGRKDSSGRSESDFYIVSSSPVYCSVSGGYHINERYDFLIMFHKKIGSSNDFPLVWGILRRVINGDTVIIESAFSSTNPGCSRSGATIQITKETDDYIEGMIEAEFFYVETRSAQTCAERRSAGVLKADFAVRLEKCPTSPKIEKGIFQYNFQGKPINNYNEGFARLIPDSKFYIVASDSIECSIDGNYETNALRDTGFVITFYKDLQNNITIPRAVLKRVVNGSAVTLYSGDHVKACPNTRPVITIGKEADGIVAGSYKAEFFELIGQNPDECTSWRSVGILTASFAIPLDVCQ